MSLASGLFLILPVVGFTASLVSIIDIRRDIAARKASGRNGILLKIVHNNMRREVLRAVEFLILAVVAGPTALLLSQPAVREVFGVGFVAMSLVLVVNVTLDTGERLRLP